eukprot:UN11428
MIWLPTYLHELRHNPIDNAYAITVGVMIIGMLVSMLSGYLGDKYSPIKVLLTVGPIFLISDCDFISYLNTF